MNCLFPSTVAFQIEVSVAGKKGKIPQSRCFRQFDRRPFSHNLVSETTKLRFEKKCKGFVIFSANRCAKSLDKNYNDLV